MELQLHVSREGQRFGPYSISETIDYLRTGSLKADDLAWHEGLTEWVPLHSIESVKSSQSPKRPPPPPPAGPPPLRAAPNGAGSQGNAVNMNSWDQVRDYILSKYTVQNDEGDYLNIVLGLDGDRAQMVQISGVENERGDPWVRIQSPVGVINMADMDEVLDFLSGKVCGGLVKFGERHWVRHTMPIGDLSPDELIPPFEIVAICADELEGRFVGGDVQ